MRNLAVLSMHTSPLAQPGTGDGGGMNVYVRELSTALARGGVGCDVYTRAWSPELAAVVAVEPGLRVHHVPAGPLAEVPKERLADLVGEFTDGVRARMERRPADAIHANYWLSGLSGHALKHDLDVPLLSTFHTLARVKAEGDEHPGGRAEAEAAVMACSDAVLASNSVEAAQIASLYGADPDRIGLVPLGVEHAFFSPGSRPQARRALGLPGGVPMLLFVGRIQPLKGADVAVRALAALPDHPGAFLAVIGGPSGPEGERELARLHRLVRELGLDGADGGDRRVVFLAPQPHEVLSSYYRAADVCLVPSRSESFGLVALEAAACGTPVVAAAVGGLRTLVEHGRTGFLVEGRDPASFAVRVAELLADPVRATVVAAEAARRARGYTWSVAARRLRQVYDHVTARSLVEC